MAKTKPDDDILTSEEMEQYSAEIVTCDYCDQDKQLYHVTVPDLVDLYSLCGVCVRKHVVRQENQEQA